MPCAAERWAVKNPFNCFTSHQVISAFHIQVKGLRRIVRWNEMAQILNYNKSTQKFCFKIVLIGGIIDEISLRVVTGQKEPIGLIQIIIVHVFEYWNDFFSYKKSINLLTKFPFRFNLKLLNHCIQSKHRSVDPTSLWLEPSVWQIS